MLPYVIHGIIAEPLSGCAERALEHNFENAIVSVPPVPFLGNTYVVFLFASTTLTGPEDHRIVGCSPTLHHATPCRAPLHTHFRRGTPLHVPADEGVVCGKRHQPHPPCACRAVACTVPAILRAGPHNIPQHVNGRHRACRRAIGYFTQVRSICLCLRRAQQNQSFWFIKNESIKFCCSRGFSNVPGVVEASVFFISTVLHVRSVS